MNEMNALQVAHACAFNLGLLAFQLRSGRPSCDVTVAAFIRGEKSMAKHVARHIYRRFGPDEKRSIRDEIRDGWRHARRAMKQRSVKH